MEKTKAEDKLCDKVEKKYETFVETTEGLTKEQLDVRLLKYSKYAEETKMAKANDEQLNEAKEIVSSLSAPYSEALGALKDKMAYINLLLKYEHGDTSGAE